MELEIKTLKDRPKLYRLIWEEVEKLEENIKDEKLPITIEFYVGAYIERHIKVEVN